MYSCILDTCKVEKVFCASMFYDFSNKKEKNVKKMRKEEDTGVVLLKEILFEVHNSCIPSF